MCEGSDDIIGLVAFYLEHRDTVCRKNIFDNRYGKAYRFGRFLSLCLVGRIGFVTESAAVRVEGNAYMRRLTLGNHLFKRVNKAENGRRVLPLRVDSRILDKGVISAINQRVSVK